MTPSRPPTDRPTDRPVGSSVGRSLEQAGRQANSPQKPGAVPPQFRSRRKGALRTFPREKPPGRKVDDSIDLFSELTERLFSQFSKVRFSQGASSSSFSEFSNHHHSKQSPEIFFFTSWFVSESAFTRPALNSPVTITFPHA